MTQRKDPHVRQTDMNKTRVAAITLACITPVLTEVFSGNMGPDEVFTPIGFIFQLLAYGLPVLLIRELAVGARVGLPGLFLLGLAYSLFNEGLFAKTLMAGPPGGGMEAYAGLGVLGLNPAWTPLITVWHALHAVILPIALVSALFPSVRQARWLRTPVWVTFVLLWAGLAALGFFAVRPERAALWHLPLFLGGMAVLTVAAVRRPARTPFMAEGRRGGLGHVLVGMLAYPVLMFVGFGGASLGWPLAVLAPFPFVLVSAIYLLLRSTGAATYRPVAWLALGTYGFGSLVNAAINLDMDPSPMDKVVAMWGLFVVFAIATVAALVARRTVRARQEAPA